MHPRRPVWIVLFSLLTTAAAAAQSTASATDPARWTPAEMREDIAAFRTDFLGRDRSYSPAARAQAEAALRELERNVDAVRPLTFELRLAQIVALADNGHTLAAPGIRARHYNRVPVRLVPLGPDVRVLRAIAETSDLLGARLVAIDGHPLAQLMDSARTLVGGTTARRDRFANALLESPEQLHAMGLAASATAATYSFELPNGRKIDRQLAGSMQSLATQGPPQRWLYPELRSDEQGVWRTLLEPGKAPWSLAEPDVPFRWRKAPELDAMVIELRQVVDAPGRPLSEFLAEMTGKLTADHPRHVVLDMRMNGGGNLQIARNFMKTLPLLVPGRIFVLTSPYTFSAAISSIGYVKQVAPSRVTIVGEEVGDRLDFFAEGLPITLPQTGIVISLATQRHDYRNGCKAYTDCHPPVVQYPIAVASLAPEIAAPWTFEAYRAGRDPAMEAVAKALGYLHR